MRARRPVLRHDRDGELPDRRQSMYRQRALVHPRSRLRSRRGLLHHGRREYRPADVERAVRARRRVPSRLERIVQHGRQVGLPDVHHVYGR